MKVNTCNLFFLLCVTACSPGTKPFSPSFSLDRTSYLLSDLAGWGPGKTKWLANNAAVCSNKDRKLAETLSKSVWVSTLPYPRNTCSAFSHLMQPRGSMWQFVWWRLPPVARTEQRSLNLMSPHKFTTGISWIIIFFAVWPWDAPLEKFGFSVLLDGSYIKANY